MGGFFTFVEEVGLLDLPVAGKAFTWYGAGLKASRLDQFLVSPAWIEKFRSLEKFILQRGMSDHAPVRLTSGIVDWGPKLFRFLICCLEKMGHVKLMESEWRMISEESDSPLSMLEKLCLLKAFLKDGGVEDLSALVDTMRKLQGNLWSSHFTQLYVDGSFEPIVSLARLSEDCRGKLELPFMEEEVWEVIRCGNDCKVSCPDGYSLVFYKKGGMFLKEDVCNILKPT
ncbi:hypothetical protein V6N13_060269 [Hibiscus sabdariffa]